MIGHIGGRKKSSHSRGAISFRDYVGSQLIDAAPLARHYATHQAVGWWGNNRAGNCTYASLYHRRQVLSKLTGEPFDAVDPKAALDDYEAGTGWNGVPGDVSDRGDEMINVLMRAKSVGVAGERIAGYAHVDMTDRALAMAALNAFVTLYVGADLPKAVDDEPMLWDIPDDETDRDVPDPDRGHAFILTGFDHDTWDLVTWARTDFRCTNKWQRRCISEAWVPIDEALVTGVRPSPAGFDVNRLRADIQKLGGVL